MSTPKITQIEGVNVSDLITQIAETVTEKVTQLVSKDTANTDDKNELLTRKEVAKYLSVTVMTVHNWTKAGILNPYRIGNKLRYQKSEVLKALQRKNPSENEK